MTSFTPSTSTFSNVVIEMANMSSNNTSAAQLPQPLKEELLTSLEQQDWSIWGKIAEFVKFYPFNINFYYSNQDTDISIDMATQSVGKSKFMRIFAKIKCDVFYIQGIFAIQEVVENSAVDIFLVFRSYDYSESPDTPRLHLNTPSYMAVKRGDVKMMRLSLEDGTNLLTGFHQGSVEAINLLIEFLNLDLDFRIESQRRTHRQLIQHEKCSQLEEKLQNQLPYDKKFILYCLLGLDKKELFENLVNNVETKLLNEPFNDITFFQLACIRGFVNVVVKLLQKGVDPNTIVINDLSSLPIIQAAVNGHYEIFVRLMNDPNIRLQIEGKGSVLHGIIFHIFRKKWIRHKPTFDKCLESLLKESIPQGKLDIDFKDYSNNTALHKACLLKHKEHLTKLLVYSGANVLLKDSRGSIPLLSIKTTILEEFLDDCVSSRNKSYLKVYQEEVTFDYRLFAQSSGIQTAVGREMEFFSIIEAEPGLRQILKHPVSKSFLYMKWLLVKKYYYVNLAFYFTFCVSLLLFFYQNNDESSSSISKNYTSAAGDTDECHSSLIMWYNFVLAKMVLLCYAIFVTRELFQFSLAPKSYMKIPENWLEMVVIFLTGFFLIFEIDSEFRSFVAACVILASHVELLFLIGKHPLCSIQIEIFKTVGYNFLIFFSFYSIIILSFAFSLYILFHDDEHSEEKTLENQDEINKILAKNQTYFFKTNNYSVNSWRDPMISLFKLIIMLTGEFDASTIPFGSNFTYKILFFIIFVFLIPILLYNILSGLAVSDIQAIRNDAELFALSSQVKLILQLEELAICNPFHCIGYFFPSRFDGINEMMKRIENTFSSFYKQFIYEKIALFPKLSPKNDVGVLYFQKNEILLPLFEEEYRPWKMPSSIVNQALQILENRDEYDVVNDTDNSSLEKRGFRKRPIKFQSIDKLGQHLVTQIHDLELKIVQQNAKSDEKLRTEIRNFKSEIRTLLESFSAGCRKRKNARAVRRRTPKNKFRRS